MTSLEGPLGPLGTGDGGIGMPARRAVPPLGIWSLAVMQLSATLLLTAGAMKLWAHPLAHPLIAPWAARPLGGVELLLGAWLASGWKPTAARIAGALAMLALSVASMALLLRGEASCGCFGPLRIHPGIMAIIDGAFAISLGASSPPAASWRSWRTFLAIVPLAIAAAGAAWTQTAQVGGGSAAALFAPPLDRGSWLVVTYRPSCGHCRQALPDWVQYAAISAEAADAPHWAFVDVEAHSRGFPELTAQDGGRFAHFVREAEWESTPMAYLVEDGKVVGQSPDPLDLMVVKGH